VPYPAPLAATALTSPARSADADEKSLGDSV